jgi:hypothetical protein
MRMELSTLAVAATGQKLHHASVVTKCECAAMVFEHRADLMSQHRTVLSSDDVNKYLPPGWNTMERIQLSCPFWKVQ